MRTPRLGFLGVGWIGRHRMQAILESCDVTAVGIADPAPEMAAQAQVLAPLAAIVDDLDALLALGLDGLVIATPSAQHAEQSIRALERGVAVFCQKPLGRNATEVAAVVEAARRADRLLGVDFSYRATTGMQRIRELIRCGSLGQVYAVDLVFHNAYGPDKAWFYDPARSGGGCLMDLGVHMIDLALWALDGPEVTAVTGALFAKGEPLPAGPATVEDYATATMRLESGAVVRLACSWRSHAGRDAVIGATFYGTDGGAEFRNVGGSFYDFLAEQYHGTARETVATPPDAWGGRMASEWCSRIATQNHFDPAASQLLYTASVLDRIYGRPGASVGQLSATSVGARSAR
jgi:predicted dehydrogenase